MPDPVEAALLAEAAVAMTDYDAIAINVERGAALFSRAHSRAAAGHAQRGRDRLRARRSICRFSPELCTNAKHGVMNLATQIKNISLAVLSKPCREHKDKRVDVSQILAWILTHTR